ncbi:TRAP-type C4-dicarboxylate transport system permease small subunit [Salirhabdus euzebyi]|uniref:TRAP-type C4-dicarboxylate transport system permease small subunit n=1 Tax=Salirhabdus euzebyi TaxID=394506 RepID=A0A841Q1I7_9BACI|nr:hypothetical protein [Salirhabdus euzebyi]MBB6451655.1 TRAP-type C4-dicarboxylate transport system permease small subunit [Salirhabdus euzebyi]
MKRLKILNYICCFIVGLGFMSLPLLGDSMGLDYNNMTAILNWILFYVGYILVIVFGITVIITAIKNENENN